MRVYLCIPVLNNYRGLAALRESLDTSSLPVTDVLIVNNGKGRIQQDARTRVFTTAYNYGVARSWNLMLRYALQHHPANDPEEPMLVVSNDDVMLHQHTLRGFEQMLQADPAIPLLTNSKDEWSLFCIRPSTLQTLGYFDEAFFPAYWEDKDYDRRLNLAGLPKQMCEYATCDHVGSQTIAAYEEHDLEVKHHRFFRANRAYYERKWGGLPPDERYTVPFNGDPDIRYRP